MQMIFEASTDGFVNAMNAQFQAAYKSADDLKVANYPTVIAARRGCRNCPS